MGVVSTPGGEGPWLAAQDVLNGVAAYSGGVRAHQVEPFDEGVGKCLRRSVGVTETLSCPA